MSSEEPRATRWDALEPSLQRAHSLLLAIAVLWCVVYAAGGLIYGWMHVFSGAGLMAISGLPVQGMAVASLCLAAAGANHLWRRHVWRGLDPAAWRRGRRRLYVVAILAGVIALVADGWPSEPWGSMLRTPRGWDEAARWPLTPLGHAWPWLIDFAGDRFIARAWFWGFLVSMVGLVLGHFGARRPYLISLGFVACLFAAFLVGDAALDVAAVDGPARLREEDSLRAYRAHPGRYVAGVFLQYWSGLLVFVLGVLWMLAALRAPRQMLPS